MEFQTVTTDTGVTVQTVIDGRVIREATYPPAGVQDPAVSIREEALLVNEQLARAQAAVDTPEPDSAPVSLADVLADVDGVDPVQVENAAELLGIQPEPEPEPEQTPEPEGEAA